MKNPKPLKRFGQNYLTDQNILSKIAEEVNPQPGDKIIEIGPGTGALTAKLLEKIPSITAVEIDTRVIEELKLSYPEINLIRGDFLDIDLTELYDNKKLRIAGNIPYNLTSPILFKLIENNNIISDAVLMVQFEVAQRMTAQKGSKDYSILSVILKYFSDVKISFKVSPNVFYPKPKVYSAVIHIFMKEKQTSKEADRYLIKMVKAAFGNRRKTLKNSLSNSIFGNINFSGSGIDLSLRAEQLDLEDFVKLAEYARIYQKNNTVLPDMQNFPE
ncbi:MAG: 16S rRNA (adenine(1518)-N(6)/adenine(1519)-N(6))-dimethyltransferase RsmA [Ignavibacteriaceae bacterium]